MTKTVVKSKNAFFVYFSLKMAQKEEEKNKNEIDFEKQTLEKETFTSFENEIRFLEKEGAMLLGQVQIQENYMNCKQQQNVKVDRYDLNELEKMVEKFLRILALIDAYQYFQSKNEMLTDENIGRFLFIVNDDYSLRINKFINDLKAKQVKTKLKSKLIRSKSK